MQRRAFIKGTILATAVLAADKVFAGKYDSPGSTTLNQLTNRESPSVLEQKHVPALEVPQKVEAGSWFDVKVKVGFMQEHPSSPGHWITEIKLLLNGAEVAKTEFKKGGITSSFTSFRIRLEKTSTVEAVEHCNLHGTWISDSVKVEVS
jgi:superoxide reductase